MVGDSTAWWLNSSQTHEDTSSKLTAGTVASSNQHHVLSTALNIVFLTTEAVPFAKTGGLADVCGTLPSRLAGLGHRTALIMPAFRSIRQSGLPIESTDISFAIPMTDKKLIGGRLLRSQLPGGNCDVWFIDQPQYFDRESLYGNAAGDYPDNAERFAFFCRAAIQAMIRIGWDLDIIHCNDWQTGLVPALIRAQPNLDKRVRSAATVTTIHNLAYQGSFGREAFQYTGLDWSHFNADEFEYYDQMNFLKTGIVTSDAITTVSPRYAQEICTPEHGCGLDHVLTGLSSRLSGITNGIDLGVWDPQIDTKIPYNYDLSTWREGKAANKRALQEQFNLPLDSDTPMIGLVGRLAEQKGWDLVLPVLRWHLSEGRPTQWIVLGSGDAQYEKGLIELAHEYPNQFALHIGFSDKLAHQIEAGTDIFVMPSRYEPCGLNQLYSLRYGTVPIVTPTGGLADTVVDTDEESIKDGTATGFYIPSSDAASLDLTIGRALHMRYHNRDQWEQIVQTGMSQDWSWRKSANQYAKLYAQTIALATKPK